MNGKDIRDPLHLWEIFSLILIILLTCIYAYYDRYLFDDAYMFIRYARNILDQKQYVWNIGGPRLDGLTSPLWLMMVLYSFKIFQIHPHSYDLFLWSLSLFFGIVFILMIFITTRILLPKGIKFIAILFLIMILYAPYYLPYHSTTGMETSLGAVLLILYIYNLILISESSGAWDKSVLIGILGFACVLSRPEFGIFILLAPFLLWLKQKKKNVPQIHSSFLILLVGSSCLLLYALIRVIYFGRIFPCSFYVKGSLWFFPYEDYNSGEKAGIMNYPVRFIKDSLLFHLFILLSLTRQGNGKRFLWLWVPLYISILYTCTTLQVMGYGYRYFFPFMVGLLYLLIVSWRDIGDNPGNKIYISLRTSSKCISFILFLSLLLLNAGGLNLYLRNTKSVRNKTHPFTRLFQNLPTGISVAATEVGELSAFNPQLVVYDLSGLNDLQFCRGFQADLLFQRDPDIITLVHDHYQGIIKQIWRHPEFKNYLCAVNLIPNKKEPCLSGMIYIRMNSPHIKEILEHLRVEPIKDEIVALGGRFGFYNTFFPLTLTQLKSSPFMGSVLGARNDQGMNDHNSIHPCDPFSLFMGSGWYPSESWRSFGCARALEISQGRLFIPLDSPTTLVLSLSFLPYQPEGTLPPSLRILCNRQDLSQEYFTHSGVNNHQWTLPERFLKTGINELDLIPSGSLRPVYTEKNNTDTRLLSIWLHSGECVLAK